MQRLWCACLLLLAGCLPMTGSWGKRQHSSQQLLQQQQLPTAAVLDVGAEEQQNQSLQEGETAYMQCRIRNLQNRLEPKLVVVQLRKTSYNNS